MRRRAGLGALVVWIVTSIVAPAVGGLASAPILHAASTPVVQASVCLAEARLDLLNRLFDGEPAGVIGADYQRATVLADGRVLWTFQDAAIRVGPHEIRIVHNIAAIQDGACFGIMYGGSRGEPEPYLLADRTVPFKRWYWPLDAEVGTDGLVHVFVAEMVERGDAYLTRSEPISTVLVTIDPETMQPIREAPAPNHSAALYGWSVTSDPDWTYLYAHCYRQFGFDDVYGVAAHDRSCSTAVTVGRVRRGRLLDVPQYWDGSRWQGDPSRAASVVPADARLANPAQIEWTGASFVSISKIDDWWGDEVVFGRSTSPTGPFQRFDVSRAPLKCVATVCNTFFATWVPSAAASRPPNTLGWSIAHNHWDGVITADYRPSFHTVAAPPFLPRGVVYPVTVAGAGGASGVPVLNVTVVGPSARGHATVFPCDRAVPTASNVNYGVGETVANLVMVRPDAAGRVCVASHADTNVVIDLAGRLGQGYQPRDNPLRIVDTRRGVGGPEARLVAGEVFAVVLPAGTVGVPVLNVTVVGPSAQGHATVFPCDRAVPTASNVNYGVGETVANLVMVRPDAAGRVCVVSHADADLVVDLQGTLTTGALPSDSPLRIVDTRRGVGGPEARLVAGEVFAVVLPAGTVGVPVLNVTVVGPSARGHATVFPCDRAVPTASNVNYGVGETVANLVMVRPDAAGRVCVVSHADADLVVDLQGTLIDVLDPADNPARVVDTRRLP